jgi:hypothetical protein
LTGSAEHRLAAIATLREVYAAEFDYLQRLRYHELTGEWLPAPPPLPDVSALLPAWPDLDTLMTGVNALLRALPAGQAALPAR